MKHPAFFYKITAGKIINLQRHKKTEEIICKQIRKIRFLYIIAVISHLEKQAEVKDFSEICTNPKSIKCRKKTFKPWVNL